jgi:hypothetical protein
MKHIKTEIYLEKSSESRGYNQYRISQIRYSIPFMLHEKNRKKNVLLTLHPMTEYEKSPRKKSHEIYAY